jgi:hypothetical protein
VLIKSKEPLNLRSCDKESLKTFRLKLIFEFTSSSCVDNVTYINISKPILSISIK